MVRIEGNISVRGGGEEWGKLSRKVSGWGGERNGFRILSLYCPTSLVKIKDKTGYK